MRNRPAYQRSVTTWWLCDLGRDFCYSEPLLACLHSDDKLLVCQFEGSNGARAGPKEASIKTSPWAVDFRWHSAVMGSVWQVTGVRGLWSKHVLKWAREQIEIWDPKCSKHTFVKWMGVISGLETTALQGSICLKAKILFQWVYFCQRQKNKNKNKKQTQPTHTWMLNCTDEQNNIQEMKSRKRQSQILLDSPGVHFRHFLVVPRRWVPIQGQIPHPPTPYLLQRARLNHKLFPSWLNVIWAKSTCWKPFKKIFFLPSKEESELSCERRHCQKYRVIAKRLN